MSFHPDPNHPMFSEVDPTHQQPGPSNPGFNQPEHIENPHLQPEGVPSQHEPSRAPSPSIVGGLDLNQFANRTQEAHDKFERQFKEVANVLESLMEAAKAPVKPRDVSAHYARLCRAPDVFDGKKSNTQLFLHQIRLYFAANQNLFDTDRRKVDYALMLFRGSASDWAQPLVERRSGAEDRAEPGPKELESWHELEKAILMHWGVVNEEEQASNDILVIQQTKKVSDYTTRFFTLQNKLPTWHEDTLARLYIRGLKYGLQTALLKSWGTEARRPRKVAEIAQQALEHESLFETHHRKQDHSTPAIGSHPPRVAPTTDEGDPMQLDFVKRLDDTERARRREAGLCFLCGKKNHKARDCRQRLEQARKKLKKSEN